MATIPEPRSDRRWWRGGLLLLLLAGGGWWLWPYVQATYQLRQARQDLTDRRFEEAERRLSDALRIWPNDAKVNLLASRAARQLGKMDEARARLDAVPDEGAYRVTRALERALIEASDGRMPQYESFLRRQVEQNPSEATAILDVLSFQCMRSHRLPDAVRDLNRWAELEPDNVEPLIRRGWVAERLLDKDSAIRDYREVLKRDPDRDPVRLRLAELLLERDSTEALAQFRELAKRTPDDAEVTLGIARARLNLAELDEAAACLERLERLQPDHVGAMIERGRLYLARRDPSQAEIWLKQALARSPHHREAMYRLLKALQAQGKNNEVALVKKQLDRIDADLGRMNKLMPKINDRPDDPALRTEIGKIFLRNSLESDGVRWLNTALEYDPKFAEAHEALAEYHEKHGNTEQAAKHREVLARLKSGT